MTNPDPILQKKAIKTALLKVYAPQNCPKVNKKGKCFFCARLSQCDKDFEARFHDERLAAYGQAYLAAMKAKEAKKATKVPKAAPTDNGGPEAPEGGPAAPAEPQAAPAGGPAAPATPEAPAAAPEAPQAPEEPKKKVILAPVKIFKTVNTMEVK